MPELLALFGSTVLLRPYVFVFLAVYVAAGATHMGWKRTLAYVPTGYGLAWASEYSSIHWGFPYGDYYYIHDTVGRELWVLGVPFMDSLSYVFLSYCSYATAIFLLSPVYFKGWRVYLLETRRLRRDWSTLVLGAFLFVLLDIIIDPVALQGYRWFLGQIYGYRNPGIYFGIPMSNFGGWLLVGLVLVGALQRLDGIAFLESGTSGICRHRPWMGLAGPALYFGVLAFNLSVTFWIGEHLLGAVGLLILSYAGLVAVFFTLYKQVRVTRDDVTSHLHDFPASPASRLMDSGVFEEHCDGPAHDSSPDDPSPSAS
jgi:putative membrane protein